MATRGKPVVSISAAGAATVGLVTTGAGAMAVGCATLGSAAGAVLLLVSTGSAPMLLLYPMNEW